MERVVLLVLLLWLLRNRPEADEIEATDIMDSVRGVGPPFAKGEVWMSCD